MRGVRKSRLISARRGILWVWRPLVLVILAQLPGQRLGAQQTGDILGQLIEERSSRPVAGAAVQLVGTTFQSTTDEYGVFRLRNVPRGQYRLQVNHIAYGPRAVDVTVEPGNLARILVSLSETAITLAPLTVDAISADERQARGTGFRRSVVTREQLARAENSHMTLADVLRAEVPNVRVRRAERVLGSPTCIEFRTTREAMGTGCLSPAVYLDGAPVTNPTTLYDNINIEMIESMEFIPVAEAGVRFGPTARYGALLIVTRRPGGAAANPEFVIRRHNFDWRNEPQGHRTSLVLLSTMAGNAAGLAVGLSAARQCLHLRTPSNDGIVSDCSLLPTLGSGVAALLLPALGSSLASRLVGQTDQSRGQFMPAAVGTMMAILPGYALALSAKRNGDASLETIGYVLIGIGGPIITTASDYLFRKLRKTPDEGSAERQ